MSQEIGIFHPDYLLWDHVPGDRHMSPRPTCYGISSKKIGIFHPDVTAMGSHLRRKAYFTQTYLLWDLVSEDKTNFTWTYLLWDLVWEDRHISPRRTCYGISSTEIGIFNPDLPAMGSCLRRYPNFTWMYLLWDLVRADRHIPTCYGISSEEIGIYLPVIGSRLRR